MDVSESRPRSADNLRKETQKKKTSTSSLDSTEKLQIVLLLVSFQDFRDRKKNTHKQASEARALRKNDRNEGILFLAGGTSGDF